MARQLASGPMSHLATWSGRLAVEVTVCICVALPITISSPVSNNHKCSSVRLDIILDPKHCANDVHIRMCPSLD